MTGTSAGRSGGGSERGGEGARLLHSSHEAASPAGACPDYYCTVVLVVPVNRCSGPDASSRGNLVCHTFDVTVAADSWGYGACDRFHEPIGQKATISVVG
eukprot:871197-Prorocentrum_minimum.AAC.1